MWGDVRVWSGSREVIVLKWYERLWRWITFANGKRRYAKIAQELNEGKNKELRLLLAQKLYQLEERQYGDLRTTLGGERDGQP